MKKTLFVICLLSASLFLGCSSDSNEKKIVKKETGKLNNKISCSENIIEYRPIEFELDCTERKLFRVFDPQSNDDLVKFFVSDCNAADSYKSAMLYEGENKAKLLISHKEFVIAEENIFCDGIDECAKACKAHSKLKDVKNINEKLEDIKTFTESL